MVRALLRWRPQNAGRIGLRKNRPKQEGLVVTTGYGTVNFAIKVDYYVLAAGVVVFVAMLILALYP